MKNFPLFEKLDGSKLSIGIVVAKWNQHITDELLAGCIGALKESNVSEDNIVIRFVPGSYELVYGAKSMIDDDEINVDAVVAIGCLIKGETMHFEYIADSVSHGLMQLNIETGVPVIFGVLACLNEEHAVARSSGEHNHGINWGKSAIEMALFNTKKN